MRSDNHDQTPQGLMEELLEAFSEPIPPTAEDLDEGSRYATGGFVTPTDQVWEPLWEVGHGCLLDPDDLKTTRGGVWEPQSLIYNHTVSQTFPMSTNHFRQFMKILGDYRLPGDKPLIHKGKKR